MKRYLFGIIGLIAVIGTILLANDYKIESELKVPEPIIENTSVPPINSPISIIQARAEVSIKEIQRLINAKVPKSLSGSEADPTDFLRNDTLTWNVKIGTITLSEVNGGLKFVSTVSGKANIKGKIGRGALKVSFSETGNVRGKITGFIKPIINSNWTINPKLSATADIKKAKVKIIGNTIPISLRGKIQGKVDKEVSKLSKDLSKHLNKDIILKNEMLKLWDQAHIIESLNESPNVWIKLTPEQIGAEMTTANNKLIVNVITKVASSINVQNEMPVLVKKRLPAPAKFDGNKNDFSIVLPVIANLNDFNRIKLKELGIENIVETDAAKIKISDVRLFGDSNRLFISANTQSDIDYIKRVNAKIFLSGEPVFDDKLKILKVKNIKYDIKTKNILLGVADFLLEDTFLNELEKLAQFNLNIDGESINDLANKEIAKLLSTLPESIKPSLDIDDTGISKLFIEDGRLIAMVHASGSASVKFSNLEKLFK